MCPLAPWRFDTCCHLFHPLRLSSSFICVPLAWHREKKIKNLFSRHLIGRPPPFFICERLDLRFSRACFQFLGGPDEDEWWKSALWCFQYCHLVLTSRGFPIKDLGASMLKVLNPGLLYCCCGIFPTYIVRWLLFLVRENLQHLSMAFRFGAVYKSCCM